MRTTQVRRPVFRFCFVLSSLTVGEVAWLFFDHAEALEALGLPE